MIVASDSSTRRCTLAAARGQRRWRTESEAFAAVKRGEGRAVTGVVVGKLLGDEIKVPKQRTA